MRAPIQTPDDDAVDEIVEGLLRFVDSMGLTNEMKLYDGWHQARYVRIADGSAEIMRRNIARSILK